MKKKQLASLLLLVIWSLSACSGGSSTSPAANSETFKSIALKRVFETVDLNRPVAFLPGPDNGWYVVEQAGRVLHLSEGQPATVFADIQSRVNSVPNEAGLLGMALDPNFAQNGRVYFSYTRDGSPLISVVARFNSRDGGVTLDTDSEQVLLSLDQPYDNHNGGQITFGPDGYLYIGFGDGGSGGDPQGRGQNTASLLGAMLRIDVSGSDAYQIPADNPFAQGGGRAEIYAWGLRNPWRWSFDRQTGELWAADVGQNQWEEVNRIQRGGNYGWALREGAHCFKANCDSTGLIDPVAEYDHSDGCSITGGYVYRGTAITGLAGVYLYGDFCSGRISGLFPLDGDGFENRSLLQTELNIASFGEGTDGELYVLDLAGGIYRIETLAR